MSSSVIAASVAQAPRSDRPSDGAAPGISFVVVTCNRAQALPDGVSAEVIGVGGSVERGAAQAVEALAGDRIHELTSLVPCGGPPAIADDMGMAAARGALPHVLADRPRMRGTPRGGIGFLNRAASRDRIGPSLTRQANRDAKLIERACPQHVWRRKERGAMDFTLRKALAKGSGAS